jgi:hypothetical protein
MSENDTVEVSNKDVSIAPNEDTDVSIQPDNDDRGLYVEQG